MIRTRYNGMELVALPDCPGLWKEPDEFRYYFPRSFGKEGMTFAGPFKSAVETIIAKEQWADAVRKSV